jgi:hypothetical protein
MGTILYEWVYRDSFTTIELMMTLIRIGIVTLLIPIVFLCFLKATGKIDSLMIEKPEQRKIPLGFQVLLMSLLLMSNPFFEMMPSLYLFFLGGMAATLIALVFLFLHKKVSLHMIGISALTVFAMGISLETGENLSYFIAFLFVACGAVASSRLHLKAHTPSELLLGLISGIVPQLILWYVWL